MKLEKDEFKCISPVIVAKGLAHECLIGINVLVRWPVMKEAISALLKKQPVVGEENRRLLKIQLIARLNNIGLPQIIADNEFKNKLLLKQTLVREGRKVTPSETEHNESSLELRVSGNNQSEEVAGLVDEQKCSANCMPENRGAKCINVIASRDNSREKEEDIEEAG